MKSPSIVRGSAYSPLLVWIAKVSVLFILTCILLYTLFKGPSSNFTISIPGYKQNNARTSSSFPYSDYSVSLQKSQRWFWESLKPGFACPQSQLIRVGAIKDGGKWTCGLANLGRLHADGQPQVLPNCLIYSFGVSKDSSFEAEALETTNCDVYAFDPTVDVIGKPLKPSNPRVHFQKLGLDSKNSTKYRTLKTLMEENGHEHQWIDILKIDIEGAEFRSLNQIMDDFKETDDNEIGLPFGQLLLEVHVGNWKENTTDRQAVMVVDFFKRLESFGLRMFTYEVNIWAGSHCCAELSFINTKSFALNRFLDVNELQ